MQELEQKPEGAKVTNLDAYMENMRVMNLIIREMKEIAELPSEAPKDTNPLERVEFPAEGGVLTYMGGHDYPYRGFPYFEFVDKIDLIKKISRAFLSGTFHALKGRSWLWYLTFLPSVWFARVFLRIGVYIFYRIVERFRIKKERYSQCIRELHRSFSLGSGEFRSQLRDLVCMVLEFDNAYRYRMQDVLAEMNQERIKTHTADELIRLLEIMSKRERTQEIKDTWKLLKIGVRAYLMFDRELKNILAETLSQLDLEKIKLTVEDEHYCRPRQDYNFKFTEND